MTGREPTVTDFADRPQLGLAERPLRKDRLKAPTSALRETGRTVKWLGDWDAPTW